MFRVRTRDCWWSKINDWRSMLLPHSEEGDQSLNPVSSVNVKGKDEFSSYMESDKLTL